MKGASASECRVPQYMLLVGQHHAINWTGSPDIADLCATFTNITHDYIAVIHTISKTIYLACQERNTTGTSRKPETILKSIPLSSLTTWISRSPVFQHFQDNPRYINNLILYFLAHLPRTQVLQKSSEIQAIIQINRNRIPCLPSQRFLMTPLCIKIDLDLLTCHIMVMLTSIRYNISMSDFCFYLSMEDSVMLRKPKIICGDMWLFCHDLTQSYALMYLDASNSVYSLFHL